MFCELKKERINSDTDKDKRNEKLVVFSSE